jgi:hypothetical protein
MIEYMKKQEKKQAAIAFVEVKHDGSLTSIALASGRAPVRPATLFAVSP